MAEIVKAGARGSSAPYREAGVDADGGLLFEPRAFWSTGSVDAQVAAAGNDPEAQTLRFDREHFRNGGRWPIKLTRLAVAPLNYTFQSYEGVVPTLDRHFRNCMAGVNFVELLITPPARQHLMKQRVSASMFANRPTGQPTMRFDADAPYASSIWGSSFMRFDKPLRLPPKTAIEMDLSTVAGAFGSVNSGLRAQVAFYERGGGWNGDVRTRETPNELLFVNSLAAPQNGFPVDGFGASNGDTSQTWDPTGRVMSAGDFVKADPSRQGSLAFDGMSVWIDQMAYDEQANTYGTGPALGASSVRVAPMSLRTGTRIRTRNGGTGTYWWRPGCPLALVANEITPALTYDLPNPITLEPGDCLDVQMWGTFGTTVGTFELFPIYNLAVALTGFAIIQG